jgi:hypothetical protein
MADVVAENETAIAETKAEFRKFVEATARLRATEREELFQNQGL